MMKTVGIITTFRQPNWGSVLQAYALQKYIKALGYNCTIIDYLYPNEFHFSKGMKAFYSSKATLKNRIARLLGLRPKTKMQLLNEFIKNEMTISDSYNYTKIHNNPPQYDIYITGSDQVRNPNTMLGDMSYFFDFVKDCKNILSYASSFACSDIPNKFKNQYIHYLSRYNNISVREENGKKLIKELIGREVKVVLDPTLLIDGQTWTELSKKSIKLSLPQNYILFYMLAYTYNPDDAMTKLLNKVQKQTKYPIIPIGKLPNSFKGYIYDKNKHKPIGVYEFLLLLKNASVIVTSSFHGTAFAVNFGRPFVSLIDDKSSDDRIYTLLSRLNLQNQIIRNSDIDKYKLINFSYDIIQEQNKLNELRKDSCSYLINAIHYK